MIDFDSVSPCQHPFREQLQSSFASLYLGGPSPFIFWPDWHIYSSTCWDQASIALPPNHAPSKHSRASLFRYPLSLQNLQDPECWPSKSPLIFFTDYIGSVVHRTISASFVFSYSIPYFFELFIPWGLWWSVSYRQIFHHHLSPLRQHFARLLSPSISFQTFAPRKTVPPLQAPNYWYS